MDNIRLGQFTSEQERFLDQYFTDQEVDRTKVYELVSALADVPVLRDVRMELEGGLISWHGLKVVADVDNSELLLEMVKVGSQSRLSHEQLEQRYQARAVSTYERLEESLGRPGLFQDISAREVHAGHPLENRTEVAYFELRGTVAVGRNEGTRYKVELPVPVELRVH